MSPKNVSFEGFVPEALDALSNTSERYFQEFNIHKAFVYWIAELFETTESDRFTFTDGANDHSIDFAIRAPQSYSIYQCKCPDVDTLEASSTPPTYDAAVVNELLEAIAFMQDADASFKANAAVRDIRSNYQQDLRADQDATRLQASLSVLGTLTPAAREAFEAARDSLFAKGVTLQLIDWQTVSTQLRSLTDSDCSDVTLTLSVDDLEKDVLHQNEWLYALVYARDLVAAMDRYGVRLFDLNVRHEIPRSQVNAEIGKSVQHAKTRRVFHHLNNGLLVTCSSFSKKPDGRVVVKGAQVVNGCQTVSSLFQSYRILPPSQQQDFDAHVRVGVKIIRNADRELLEQIVISTNNQNPMKPRNLRSNTAEQKSIQASFQALNPRWFYVRKDGEFESLCAAGKRARRFSRQDYRAELPAGVKPRDRVLDNVAVAKAWYAWIGSSHSVLTGGLDYFGNENLYERVFKQRPSDEYWSTFADPEFEGAAKGPMDGESPGAHQYLLAASVAAYMRATSISSYANRRLALQRGLESGKLKGNAETGTVTSSSADQAAWLAKDQQYLFNTYLINMEDVLVELFAFTLARRYGGLTPATSRQILRLPDFDFWQRSGFHVAPELLRESYPDGPMIRTAEFVRWAAKNYCGQNKFQIDAAPRAKMYFGRRDTVKAMREVLLESDSISKQSVFPWKPETNRSFLDTLPALDIATRML